VDLPVDFKELLEEFARSGVEAVLVGGYAVAFHGRPRATKDIDLLLLGSPANLSRASEALQRFGAPPNVVRAVAEMKETRSSSWGSLLCASISCGRSTGGDRHGVRGRERRARHRVPISSACRLGARAARCARG
jgi:hypothetical protein